MIDQTSRIDAAMQALRAPFPPADINWRVGATNIIDRNPKQLKWGNEPQGIPLAYLDARNVMDRLDDAVGPANWQCDYPWSDGKKLHCRIGIRLPGPSGENEWVWKSNGAGDTAVEADKGAFSDAFKRAAVPWGVGAYLYHLPNTWVPLEVKGNFANSFSKDTTLELTKRLHAWQDKFFSNQ